MATLGRPPKFKAAFCKQAAKLCKLGATDVDLADFFGVAVRTIERWTSSQPEFCRAVKTAKSEADDRVERSLYQKAIGYERDEIKIMQYEGEVFTHAFRSYYAPDVVAQIFWLKNRRREQWRDRQDHELSASGDLAQLLKGIDGGTRGIPGKGA